MEIKLFLNKDVNHNANVYFEKAKKLKNKLPGLEKAFEDTKTEIANFEEKQENHIKRKEKEKLLSNYRKKEWFDKFRWTKTSSEFLFVIGKDASTNEVLIKKYLEENDIVFHTELPGSPFGVLKGAKDKVSKEGIDEAAQFLACFSSQWSRGFGTADVFWVEPEQVSKKAQSGEYMAKGSFMIYGKKNMIKNIPLRICIGVIKEKIVTEDEEVIEFEELFSGSENACKKFCKSRFLKVEPGKNTFKTLIKEIKSRLKVHIDELPKYIPNNAKILKK